MSEITQRPDLVARSFDTNRDGKINELQVTPAAKQAMKGADSVDALASAISNDQVVVQSGTVDVPKGALHIPSLWNNERQMRDMANSALNRTISFDYLPSHPNKDNYRDVNGHFNRDAYNYDLNNYRDRLRALGDNARLDREILTTSLRNIASSAKDGGVRNMANQALNQQFMADVFDWHGDDHTLRGRYEKYATDREVLRGALRSIAEASNIPDLSVEVAQANHAVSNAQGAIQNAKGTAETALNSNAARAQSEADKTRQSWFFGNMRANRKEKKIAEAKNMAAGVSAQFDQVQNLARQAYDLGVSAVNGYSKDDARIKGQQADRIEGGANQITNNANDTIKKINKLGK